MTIIRHTPDPVATKALASLLRKNQNDWLNFVAKSPVTYEEFVEWQIPDSTDIETGPMHGGSKKFVKWRNTSEMDQVLTAVKAKQLKNAMIYSPMSGMYWHTNSNFPGTRLYYTFSLDKAVFRYKDPATGEIHEDWDDTGWTVRQFDVQEDPLFWHSIWAAGRRFSFGFEI